MSSRSTLQDRFLAALLARGEREVKRTTKFIVVTRSKQPGTYYYLGKMGALRFGPTTRGSIPCGRKFRQFLLDLHIHKFEPTSNPLVDRCSCGVERS